VCLRSMEGPVNRDRRSCGVAFSIANFEYLVIYAPVKVSIARAPPTFEAVVVLSYSS
jgi:hypothetical protein